MRTYWGWIARGLIALCVLFLLAACGGGGGGGPPPPAQTIVSGAVLAPGGQVAFNGRQGALERFAARFRSIAHAAVTGLSSVPDGTPVQLGKMTSDGATSTLATTSTSGGRYSFNLTSAGLVFANDLIVQVANPATGARMRAFVTGANVDITPASESAIQVVLDLIAATSGATLANFTLAEIGDVVGAIDALTASNQMSAGSDINTTISSIKSAVTSDPDIAAFLTSASAPGQTAEGPGDVGNFAPMIQGNTWSYQGTEQTAGQPPINYTNTATITGTKSVGGVLAIVLNESNALNNGGPEEEYYTKNSRGVTFHGSNDPGDVLSPQLVPYLTIRFPLGTGSTFQEVNKKGLNFGEDLDGDSRNEKLDVLSIVTVKGYESVTVPAGTYSNCARVERRITFTVIASSNGQRVSVQSVHTAWLAPGVGYVKQVLKIEDLTVTEVLSSFTQAESGTHAASKIIGLPDNSDLIFDPASQKIYASVRGNPGNITPIDPDTGTMGSTILTGIDPVKLARSDNGQFLYVGLEGENSIQRINLATQTVNLTYSLGSDSNFGPLFVEDMEVLPGNSSSIAVSRKYKGLSPRHAGVAIYDDGVQRATTTPGHTGSNVIEFSASAATLYGYNNETTEFGFRRMAVTQSGVSVSDVFDSFMGDLISGFGIDIKFHGGLIYTTTGRVIDPVSRAVVGTFTLPATFGNLVAADANIGRVFFLTRVGFSGTWSIHAFNLSTRQLLGKADIPGVAGVPSSLIRWGAKGLAFRTNNGQVFLIESSELIP